MALPAQVGRGPTWRGENRARWTPFRPVPTVRATWGGWQLNDQASRRAGQLQRKAEAPGVAAWFTPEPPESAPGAITRVSFRGRHAPWGSVSFTGPDQGGGRSPGRGAGLPPLRLAAPVKARLVGGNATHCTDDGWAHHTWSAPSGDEFRDLSAEMPSRRIASGTAGADGSR